MNFILKQPEMWSKDFYKPQDGFSDQFKNLHQQPFFAIQCKIHAFQHNFTKRKKASISHIISATHCTLKESP